MKVLIVAVADFPHGFATGERIRMIGKTIKQGGGEVELALIHSARSRSQSSADMAIAGEYDGISYRYMNGVNSRPAGIVHKIIDTLIGVCRTAACIYKQHQSDNLDAVIFYTPNFLKILPALLVAKLCHLACFFELCEIRTSVGNNAALSRARRLASIGDYMTEKLAPKFASGLIVISPKIMAYYAGGLPAEKIFYLPALADSEEFSIAETTEVGTLEAKNFILSSGSFGEKEGIPFILEAFGQVAATHPDLYLVFTGNPSPQQMGLFNTMAKKHGYENRLIFTGYLSRPELVWCYKNARALLACRTASEFAQFGFPTKLVEYMLSKRPILATSVGAIAETLNDGETAYLATPENAPAIAAALKRVLEDESAAGEVAVNAYALAIDNFDYRCYVRSLNEFLNRQRNAGHVA